VAESQKKKTGGHKAPFVNENELGKIGRNWKELNPKGPQKWHRNSKGEAKDREQAKMKNHRESFKKAVCGKTLTRSKSLKVGLSPYSKSKTKVSENANHSETVKDEQRLPEKRGNQRGTALDVGGSPIQSGRKSCKTVEEKWMEKTGRKIVENQ